MKKMNSLLAGGIAVLLFSQTTSAQAKPIKVYKDPQPSEAVEIETSTDSDIESMGLSCVYDGIVRGTHGTPLANLKPAKKWLALLGAGAQDNYMVTPKYSSTLAMPLRLQKEYEKAGVTNPREQYQIKVIQMIQAFGFCASEKINANAELTGNPGIGELKTRSKISTGFMASREINEKALLRSLASGNERELNKSNYSESLRDASLVYGFKDVSNMKALFTPTQEWATMTVEQRREHFNDFLKKSIGPTTDTPSSDYLSTQNDQGVRFKNCLEDIQTLQKRSSYFQVSGPFAKNNMALCNSMADSCSLNKSICAGPDRAPRATTPPTGGTTASPAKPTINVGDMPEGGSK